MITCWIDDCDGHEYPGTTISDFLAHQRTAHLNVDLTGPGQDWHERAIAEVKRRVALGGTWTIWEIAQAVGSPENHKSRLGAFAGELRHIGLAEIVTYRKSDRPESKGSAVAVWGAPRVRESAA